MDGDKTTPGTADAVWERALTAREQVASLAATDFGVLGQDDVEGLLVVIEETVRMLPVVQQGLVREVHDRGMHADRQHKAPVPYLRDLLRITEPDAAARVRAVERFHPRTAVTGEVLPPLFPQVASAVATGEISMQHAGVIAEALRKLPAAVDQQVRVAAEERLVDTAAELDPTR